MLELNSFFFNDSQKKLLIKWIKEDYQKKPLCIHGRSGLGKTSLANVLLKEYKIINIDVEFIKNDSDFKEYIDLSLGKKNICMMFSKETQKQIYKSILFDDIHIIQQLDKNLFKNIILWIKQINKYKNNPIIFILTDQCIPKKTFKDIVDKSICIEVKYTDNQYYKILTKLLNEENILISLNHSQSIIKKSGKNINNIKSNISILKDNEQNKDIEVIKENDFCGGLHEIMLKILNDNFDINNILSNSFSDYNIISLNLLDNLHNFFNQKNFIKNYSDIYKSICIGDRYNSEMIIEHHYDLLEHVLVNQVLYPIYKIKQNYNKIIKEINYNKYISKSIYYISNYNTFIKNDITMNNVYYELFLYDFSINLEKKIDKKILEKYIKIYNWIFSRSVTKNKLK